MRTTNTLFIFASFLLTGNKTLAPEVKVFPQTLGKYVPQRMAQEQQ